MRIQISPNAIAEVVDSIQIDPKSCHLVLKIYYRLLPPIGKLES